MKANELKQRMKNDIVRRPVCDACDRPFRLWRLPDETDENGQPAFTVTRVALDGSGEEDCGRIVDQICPTCFKLNFARIGAPIERFEPDYSPWKQLLQEWEQYRDNYDCQARIELKPNGDLLPDKVWCEIVETLSSSMFLVRLMHDGRVHDSVLKKGSIWIAYWDGRYDSLSRRRLLTAIPRTESSILHTFSELTISGDTGAMEDFAANAGKGDDCIAFSSFLPIPKEIEFTAWLIHTDDEATEAQQELIRRYGAANSVDWTNINWGTNWDPYRTQLHRTSDSLVYTFDTLNGDAGMFVLKVSQQYPSLTFRLESVFASGKRGIQIMRNGKVFDDGTEGARTQEQMDQYVAVMTNPALLKAIVRKVAESQLCVF